MHEAMIKTDESGQARILINNEIDIQIERNEDSDGYIIECLSQKGHGGLGYRPTLAQFEILDEDL